MTMSGMIIFLGWDISSSLLLNQIRRQERSISLEDENHYGELRGSRSNIHAQTMAICCLALEHDKPTLMEIRESPRGSAIFWNVQFTSSHQIYEVCR